MSSRYNLYSEQINRFIQSSEALMILTDTVDTPPKHVISEISASLSHPITMTQIDADTANAAAQIKIMINENSQQIQRLIIISPANTLSETTLTMIIEQAAQQKNQNRIYDRFLLLGKPCLLETLENIIGQPIPQLTLGMPIISDAPLKTSSSNTTSAPLSPAPHTSTPASNQATKAHSVWSQYGTRVIAITGLVLSILFLHWHYQNQSNNLKALSHNLATLSPSYFMPEANTKKTEDTSSTKHATKPKPLFHAENDTPSKIENTSISQPTISKKITPTHLITANPLAQQKNNASMIKTPHHSPTQTTSMNHTKATKPATPLNQIHSKPFYTLQLMSEARPQALQHYANTHQIKHKTQVYPSQFQHQPWYLLGYGHYNTAKAAAQARQQLSPELKTLKPWVRRIHE
jgi:hypothetical protein